MQEVVIVQEANHNIIINVAKDYQSAIGFLIDNEWLSEHFEIWVDNVQTIEESLGENWKDIILTWSIEQFNNYFGSCLYLTTEEVYGT